MKGRKARSRIELMRMLWERCDRDSETGCWNWTGSKYKGYGQAAATTLTGNHQPIQTHRIAYMLLVGEQPLGTHLHHKCENPSCCNPDHLELLTPQQHSREHFGDTCPAGHGEEHWRIRGDGRYCRECDRLRKQQEREARKTPCGECGKPKLSRLDSGGGRWNDSGLCLECYRMRGRRAA